MLEKLTYWWIHFQILILSSKSLPKPNFSTSYWNTSIWLKKNKELYFHFMFHFSCSTFMVALYLHMGILYITHLHFSIRQIIKWIMNKPLPICLLLVKFMRWVLHACSYILFSLLFMLWRRCTFCTFLKIIFY